MPKIATAVRWLADLGGYSGNSDAGAPGSLIIGRGVAKRATAVEILEAIRGSNKCDEWSAASPPPCEISSAPATHHDDSALGMKPI
jgi:hypothetical protein